MSSDGARRRGSVDTFGQGLSEMMARGGLAGIQSVEGVQIYAFRDGSIWLNHVEMVNSSRRPEGDRDE